MMQATVWLRYHLFLSLVLSAVINLSCFYFLLSRENQLATCEITNSGSNHSPSHSTSSSPILSTSPDPSASPIPSTSLTPSPIPRETRLVVLVLSKVKGKEQRDAIRETWMKKYRRTSEVLVKFSIGTEGISSLDIENLISESSAYDDLLLLPHLHDSYNNLTRKLLQSFVALNNHYRFSYILKCDEDTFVVLDTILRELKQRRSNQNYYWGYHYEKAKVRKKGKWAEQKWFLCDTYFPYAAGGGFILSQDLVRRIASSSGSLVIYNNEDVSIGAWLSPYDIERHHDRRFNTYPTSSKCFDSMIIFSERSKEEMFTMQRSLDHHQGLCASKTKLEEDMNA